MAQKLNKNLRVVLSGSGLVYPAHVGGLEALRETGREPSRMCGVSGGAIISALWGSLGGLCEDSLREKVLSMLPGPSNLIDWSWCPWRGYGLIRGDRILTALREVLAPTFKDLKKPIDIVVVDLESRDYKIFNPETTPDADLPLVVRASISIPFVFAYTKIDGRICVDGGVASNFPLDMYGTGENVVGFRILHEGEGGPIRGVVDYVKSVVDTMLEASVREHVEDAIFARMVTLKVQGSGLDFKLSVKQANQIIEEARRQASAVFSQLGES